MLLECPKCGKQIGEVNGRNGWWSARVTELNNGRLRTKCPGCGQFMALPLEVLSPEKPRSPSIIQVVHRAG
jgi:ribosomal protein S27AE